ncbi:Uncharacterised protein [Shigella sonnei]|nr:Uncharacterised protein [Shigella sonnei]
MYTVNQQRITNKAAASRFVVFWRTKVIQPFILDNDRKIIHIIMVGDRQRLADFIFHQPHSGKAVIDLLSRAVGSIGVIPQSSCVLANRQYGCPVSVWRHHPCRTAHQRARYL